jgi:hypothetical protein
MPFIDPKIAKEPTEPTNPTPTGHSDPAIAR